MTTASPTDLPQGAPFVPHRTRVTIKHPAEYQKCGELGLREELLDIYVLQPEALSADDRTRIEARMEEHETLRSYVEELRQFYRELEKESGRPRRVDDFVRRITGG